jgi:hypothetical protein
MSAPSPWILSRREDLLWFHGTVVAGLLLCLAFRLLPPLTDQSYTTGHAAVLLLLLWGVLFDGTHVFGTYARSYLVKDETSRTGLPGAWSLGLLLLGPALALVDHLVLPQGPSQLGRGGPLFRGFLLVAYVWAYWHLVRQHYGFLVLYQRRAGVGRREALAEQWILWAASLYPFLRFSLGPDYARSGLPLLLPAAILTPLRLVLDGAFGLLVAGCAVAALAGRRRLGPRHLLLFLVSGFHVLVFRVLDNLLVITAVLTIYHNLQYHRIVWQYERGQGRVPAGGLARYLALGGVLGLLWYGPRVLGVASVSGDLARNMLLGLGWGVAFHHYLVDGRIWRVRRTPGVGQALDRGAVR